MGRYIDEICYICVVSQSKYPY